MEAVQGYKMYLGNLRNTVLVDTETDFVKLGKAKEFAQILRLKYMPLEALNS